MIDEIDRTAYYEAKVELIEEELSLLGECCARDARRCFGQDRQ